MLKKPPFYKGQSQNLSASEDHLIVVHFDKSALQFFSFTSVCVTIQFCLSFNKINTSKKIHIVRG